MAKFWIAFFAMLFFPSHLPQLRLLYFAPYLVSCFYAMNLSQVLLRAFFVGLCIDLLSATPLFGSTALAYVTLSCLLYGQRRNFFEEKLSTLAVLTYLFSMGCSALLTLLFLIFGKGYSFSFTYLLSDILEMPILDGLYAFFLFTLPWQLGIVFPKRGLVQR